MTVEITARHLDISDSLNEFARAKADKLGGEFPAIESIRVVMDEDGPFFSAVVTVRGGRNMNADGSHRDADIHVAIT